MATSPAETLRQLTGPGNLWSYSNLEKWAACPYQWYGRYVLKIPDIPSAPLVQGILCHSALAEAIQHQKPPESWHGAIQRARRQEKQQGLVPTSQDDTLADWCATAWAQRPQAPQEMAEVAWLTPIALRPEEPRPTVDLTPAETILDSAVPYAWFKAQDAVRAVGVDAIYAQPDWVGLNGRHLQVVDWKTSQVRTGQTVHQVAERYQGQVALYTLNAQRRFHPEHVTTSIALLPAKTTVHLPITPQTLSTVARTTATRIWAIKQAAAIGAMAFPKQVGDACRYCALAQWAGACPEGTAHRRQQGWDRYDAQNREQRVQAGVIWAGDKPGLLS